eukprot:scaffold27040_cov112-Isochrysis_galbana.AAC.1
MSISSYAYASDLSAASHSHSCEITQSNPSLSSGMVQPVVNEMFANVHAAGSSLLGLFTSCTTFDSTCEQRATSAAAACSMGMVMVLRAAHPGHNYVYESL